MEKLPKGPSALLIVNIQIGYINRKTKHLIKDIECLQYYYDKVFVKIFVNSLSSHFTNLTNRYTCTPGSKDSMLAFTPRNDAIIKEKEAYSFVDEEFIKVLHENNVDTIDLCGIDTEIAITKTALDLFENNFRPRVLAEFCASMDGLETHNYALGVLKRAIGEEQVIDDHTSVINKNKVTTGTTAK